MLHRCVFQSAAGFMLIITADEKSTCTSQLELSCTRVEHHQRTERCRCFDLERKPEDLNVLQNLYSEVLFIFLTHFLNYLK